MADPSRYHHGDLRAALLERAEHVLAVDGVHGLSLRALARDLGVSHAAPARHFRDKQALLDALALAGFRRLEEVFREQMARAGIGFGARVRAMGSAYARFAAASPELLDVMFAGKHHPDASAELIAVAHRGLGLVAEVLSAAQADGVVRLGDPAHQARLLFAAVHGIGQLATSDLLDDDALDDLLEDCLTMCVRGLTVDGGDHEA